MRPKLLFCRKEASELIVALREAADRAARGCLEEGNALALKPARFCSANWNCASAGVEEIIYNPTNIHGGF